MKLSQNLLTRSLRTCSWFAELNTRSARKWWPLRAFHWHRYRWPHVG